MTAQAASVTHDYALIGYPISHSLAPFFQNTCFELEGSSSRYERWSTSRLDGKVLAWLRSDECKGAAVTMPLKAAVIPYLDEITTESQLTGAVNTVVKVRKSDTRSSQRAVNGHESSGAEKGTAGSTRLVGTNTDYLGILGSLQTAIHAQHPPEAVSDHGTPTILPGSPVPLTTFTPGTNSAAVIGGGATTRSAVLAIHRLGLGPIYLINRDEAEVKATMDWFAGTPLVQEGLQLIHLGSIADVDHHEANAGRLGIVVGAIPAILPVTPQERMVYTIVTHLFNLSSYLPGRQPKQPAAQPQPQPQGTSLVHRPIFLDMAYYPRPTPLSQIANILGCATVHGMEAMIEQGFAQQRMWRRGDASVETGLMKGILEPETEAEARRRMLVVQDVKPEGVERDRSLD